MGFTEIVFYAFRYCLGRATYAPSVFQQAALKNIEYIDSRDLKLMCQEIADADKEQRLGMDCDKVAWLNFRDIIEKQLKQREENI